MARAYYGDPRRVPLCGGAMSWIVFGPVLFVLDFESQSIPMKEILS